VDSTQKRSAGLLPLHLVLESVGLRIEIYRSDMVLGRHSQADVRLVLPDVSRRHCRLIFDGDRWRVIDLGSTNGVFVNGVRVTEAVLQDGDRLQLGSLPFRVEYMDHFVLPGTRPIISLPQEKRLAS